MSGSVVPFNFTLPPVAGLWVYAPYKQGIAEAAWNASYTESTSWPDPKTQDTVGAGISYFRTQYPQGQVSINFAGTGIYLCYTDNGAEYVLSLDGKGETLKIAPGDSDDACKATGASTMAYANNLELGGHIATLRTAASPSNEFQFFGGQLTTTVPATGDVGKAPKVVDKWVDDTDPAFIFQPPSGGLDWDRNGGGAGLHNLTATYHCRWGENNLTSYSFTGAGAAALYGRAWRDTHDFTVDIQGGSVKETLVSAMSTSGWYMSQALVWMRGNLDPKTTYTITYRDYSSSNPTCIVNYPIGADRHPCCIGLDAVKLFSAEAGETTGEKPPPKPKSSSNIGPIVGGVVGGLACAAAIFALFIFMLRRKRKQKVKQEIDPAHWGTTSVPATYTTSSDPRYGAAAATPWSPMPTHSSPPASTVQTNNYFGAPSSIAPSTHATAPATAPAPLGQADMDRVLEFVQRQMDTRPVGRDEDEGGTVLPPYSHH